MATNPNPLAVDPASLAADEDDPVRAVEVSELAALLTELGAVSSELPPFPPSAPALGQTHETWIAEVARRRAEHDTAALTEQLSQGAPIAPHPEVRRAWGEVTSPAGPVGVRWYSPDVTTADVAIAYFHGGAFWMGGGAPGFAMNDVFCARLCAVTGATVVNVDYRLAPEHRFPAQLDDGAAVVGHLAERFDRVAVAGTSSGGFLCTGLARRARGGEVAPIALAVLIQPAVQLVARGWTPADVVASTADEDPATALRRRIAEYYLLDEPDWAAPHVSLAHDGDLSGLAPTILVTGDQDPLAGPARRLATGLRDAGVRVHDLRYTMTHTVATPAVRARLDGELLAAIRAELA